MDTQTDFEIEYTLPQLLKVLIEQNGSDLHITANSPPRLRVDGLLLPLELESLNEDQTLHLCYSILTEEQKKNFESKKELDFSFSVKGLCRFRANMFLQRGSVGAVFRQIPTDIPKFRQLRLPYVVEELCHLPRGLVLVTGPTGSGKSTTLASMIDYINSHFQKHIVTIEDPIEFVHQNKMSLVNQRELGNDTDSFKNALKSCLRQDPDVVLVGELRDLETISLAITTAETGHLVFGTLHTNSCVASINRLIDVFPSHQQSQVRTQLSFSLVGVMSQLLAPALEGGRVACIETMIPNAAIKNLIRENKIHQIYSSMQIGQGDSQMTTMSQAIAELILKGRISKEAGLHLAGDQQELNELLQKSQSGAKRTPTPPPKKR